MEFERKTSSSVRTSGDQVAPPCWGETTSPVLQPGKKKQKSKKCGCRCPVDTCFCAFSALCTDFQSWATQLPVPSSLQLPEEPSGHARKRTWSSWRTCWQIAMKISGSLQWRSYQWRSFTSLRASSTSTSLPSRVILVSTTAQEGWILLLLEIRAPKCLIPLWIWHQMELKTKVLSVSLMLEVLGVTGTVTIHLRTTRPLWQRRFSLMGGVDSSPEMMNMWVSEVLFCCAVCVRQPDTEHFITGRSKKHIWVTWTCDVYSQLTSTGCKRKHIDKRKHIVSSAAVRTYSW